MNPLLNRISVNPEICFGKPCIKGHRIWVSLILDMLAGGNSIEDILYNYPQLDREDILACIAYGAARTAGAVWFKKCPVIQIQGGTYGAQR